MLLKRLLCAHSCRWYYTSNSGLQAQSVLYTQAAPDAPASVLLDPNSLSTDGTVALNDYTFSWDGSLLAYNLARRAAHIPSALLPGCSVM
jgi:hypothetical protein